MKKLLSSVSLLSLIVGAATAQSQNTWTFEIPTSKSYTLVVALLAGAEAKGEVWSGEERLAKFAVPTSEKPRQVDVPPIFLDAGTATLTLRAKSGDLPITAVSLKDSLTIHKDPIRSVPMDPQATPEAKALLSFLVSQSGKHIISGQQDLTWNDSIDMVARVKDLTGKEPALVGYDFLNYVGSGSGQGRRQTREAISWWKKGGLVAFCWHWRVGEQREFYSKQTDFRIPAEGDTKSWALIDQDINVIAAELEKLQKAGVPVLWRPLHEASGGWFWWGASGPQAYKRLWAHLYEQLVQVHGLHNLLWVWNGQSPDWYPGDETVDIVGWDLYGNDREYVTFSDTWLLAQSIPRNEAKLVTLSENGPIPDPDLLVAQKVPWSWFMTWNDGDRRNPADDFFSGTKYMDNDFKKRVYNSPYVLTLETLKQARQ